MNLSHSQHGDVTVMQVGETRLDASNAIQFKDEFRAGTQGDGDVILDLGAVNFIDSSGLGAIVAVYKGLGTGRTMALSALQPAVERVMKLTRMNTVFAIFPTTASALSAAGPTAAE